MAYTRTTWAQGDTITAAKLNNAEQGITDNDGKITALPGTYAPRRTTTPINSYVIPVGRMYSAVAHGGFQRTARHRIYTTMTFDRIGIQVTTAVASSTIGLGILADNSGLPGAVLLNAGTIDSSSIGYKEITLSSPITISVPSGSQFVDFHTTAGPTGGNIPVMCMTDIDETISYTDGSNPCGAGWQRSTVDMNATWVGAAAIPGSIAPRITLRRSA